jgi:thiol-disulfide isomerase/thioredoxin
MSLTRKYYFLQALTGLALACALAWAGPVPAAQPAPQISIGGLAPDFGGATLADGPFRLADHIGRETVVLNFFTTDCGPCREEIPALSAFYAAHKSAMAMLGVDAVETPAVVSAFAQRLGAKYPVTIDSGPLLKAYGVTGYPTTVVIGADGTVQYWNLNEIDVPGVLGPLLQKDAERRGKGEGLSRDEFLRKQEAAGLALISLAPPEVKPVAGAGGQKDEIFGITVANETPRELDVEVDYYYSGSHGTTRVYVDCDPHLANGGAPFGMLPAALQVGRHKARAPLTAYSGTPAGAVSTTVKCVLASRLDGAQMAEKTANIRKEWGR